MPNYSKKIIYLSNEQCQELFTNQTITVDGTTITYNENDIYVTPQAEPIIDVKINNVSIGNNGIVNIPIMSRTTLGVAKIQDANGIIVDNGGSLRIAYSPSSVLKNPTGQASLYQPIVPYYQHESTFYGLSKAAGADLASVNNITVGTYPDASKAAIQNMLGITDLISTEESSTATAAHAINSTFMMDGKLHRATTAIAIGDAVEVGTNCEVVKADEVFIKNTDYATENTCGLVKINSNYGIAYFSNNDKTLTLVPATSSLIKAGINSVKPLVPYNQHQSVFYGLSKIAGVDLANETVTLGTYPETSKTAIRSLIGAAAASDLSNKEDKTVVVTITSTQNQGTTTYIADKTFAEIAAAIEAGKTVIATTNYVGWHMYYKLADYGVSETIPEDSFVRFSHESGQDAIYLDIRYDNTVEYSSIVLSTFYGISINGTQVYSNDGITNIPAASTDTFGVVKIGNGLGINSSNGKLQVNSSSSGNVKIGTDGYAPIVPGHQHESVFYGLSKAAGVDLANETVTVGTYPESSKLAINNMLGAVSKDSLDNAGITARTYTTKFGGEFSVTTATSQDYISPYVRASVTGRINKENMHRVTINGTQYILRTRLWYTLNNGLKVYEYLGNLGLYVSDISGVPGGTDNVPFVIISDINNNNSIDVLTSTAGTYTILVEQINNTQKELPKSLIYGDSYPPIEKNNNGGTYNGFSIGVNELNNKRGTVAIGYGNKITNEFSYTFGLRNTASSTGGVLLGTSNVASGSNAIAIGESNNVGSSGRAIGTDLITSGSNMTAIGRYNVNANTNFPNYTANTQYSKGDIVKGKVNAQISNIFTLMCIKDHLSVNDSNLYNDIDPERQDIWGYWKLAPGTGDTLLALGNGSMSSDRSNAMKVDWAGNLRINGDIFVNCNADSTGGTKLPTDVQINGTSIVSNGTANIPYASILTAGAVKVTGVGIGIYGSDHGALEGALYLVTANSEQIKSGNNSMPINSAFQHEAVYYGLSKLAGVNLANETVTVGTYPETSKEAIQTMLGTQAAIEVIRL